ncbi:MULTISPECIES: GNAT family N-acetyltransferase [Rhodobacterales]|uniref:GNAT family N-acetyltransferase n=1 Tax=Roseobacter sp. N2S TaxID=2663844 RepID=UPI002855CFFA|nr:MULTISPECIES: GNAT family N-acetyltransferase [Rhodobacterales]MDR6264835.1 RimJ/RimL family protein N-acetyltransferase [Roseobacter sp. N2S]
MTLTNAPTLETANLILRGPQIADFEPLAAFYASDRCAGFGAKLKRDDAWRWFSTNVGHWHIHGYGYFSIIDKATGACAGLTGIWNPEGWPEPELGYALFEGFEGRGIAREGAERARQWAFEDLKFKTLSSHIIPGNTRSIALAERMGAWFEKAYDNPHMGEDHIYRYPTPEAAL